ncbi:MAG: FUSC family protein, partial [Paucibacter sp.]|nr:FUSC family protein [Roseateles sp.]
LTYALLGAASSGLAIWLRTWPVGLVLGVLTATLLGCGLRLWRKDLSLWGLLTASAFAVSATFPAAGGVHALHYALAFAAGAAWAAAANVLLWQANPETSARRLGFMFYHAMALQLDSLRNKPSPWLQPSAPGRAILRQRLDALSQLAAKLPAPAALACRTWHCAGDRMMALLAALDSLLQPGQRGPSAAQRACVGPVLHDLAQLIQLRARIIAMESRAIDAMEWQQRIDDCHHLVQLHVALLLQDFEDLLPQEWLQLCACLISEMALLAREPHVALTNQASGVDFGRVERRAASTDMAAPSPKPAWRQPWRALLIRKGPEIRYAGRVAVSAAVAVAIAHLSDDRQGNWLVITTLFVMQPSVGRTAQISLQRLAGTALGAMLATGLEALLPTRMWLAAALFPLSIGTLAGRLVSYLSYVLFLTPQFVLVAQLGAPMAPSWELALSRLVNSLAGAAIGMTASMLLWPDWERHRLADTAERALNATRAYWSELLISTASGSHMNRQALSNSRRRACTSIDELETANRTLRLEPFVHRRRIALLTLAVKRLRALIGSGALVECQILNGSDLNGRLELELLARHLALPGWRASDSSPSPNVDIPPRAPSTSFLEVHVSHLMAACAPVMKGLATKPFR